MLTKHADRDFYISRHLLSAGTCLAMSLAVVIFASAISITTLTPLWQRNYQAEQDFLSLITKFNTEEAFTSAVKGLSERILNDDVYDVPPSQLLTPLLGDRSSKNILHISDAAGASSFDVVQFGDLPSSLNLNQMAALVSRFMIFDSVYWHDGKSKEQTFLITADGKFAAFSKDLYIPRDAQTLRTEAAVILDQINRAIINIAVPATGAIWTKKYVHPLTGNEVITCFSPVYDKQGRIAMYVGTNANPGQLLNNKNLTKLTDGETAQLVTQAGDVVASSGRFRANQQQQNTFTASLFGGLTISINPMAATISFERPIQSLGWRVIYSTPIQQLFIACAAHYSLLTLLFLAISISIFFSSRFIRRRIIIPALQRAIALEENEQFVRGVLLTAPVGLAVIDPSAPKLLISNPIYDQGIDLIKTFGAESLIGLHRKLSDTSPDQISIQIIQETLSNNEQRFYSVRTSQQILHNNFALIFAVTDISEQKRTEAELLASRSAVDSANKAKEAFLTMISHELRTPLYGVLTSLELLTATSPHESQRYLLDAMESSTRNLLELINDLLDFSKIEASKFTLSKRDVHLIPELEAVGRACATRARLQGITFDWMLDPALNRAVTTDPLRIAQIITNLISNAIKFTPTGYVALSVKLGTISDDFCQIVVTVQDSGIGIAASEIVNLFKPFSQIDNHEVHASGTGLGLSISRKLVTLLNGTIRVNSEKGKGSAFTVSLDLPWAEPVLLLQQSNGIFGYHTTIARRNWYLQSLIRQAGYTPVSMLQEMDDNMEMSGVIAFADEAAKIECGSKIILITSDVTETADNISRSDFLPTCAFNQPQIIERIRSQNLPCISPPAPQNHTRPFAFYVLVIDDHSVNGTILAYQLEVLGCMVDVYNDPEEALLAFDSDSHQLILTDMNMPGISGEQLAVRVKEIVKHVPIIAATADAAVESALFDIVLVKPFTTAQLAAAINTLIDRGALTGHIKNIPAVMENRCPRSLSKHLQQQMASLTDVDLTRCAMAIQISDIQTISGLAHRMRGAFLTADMPELAILCTRLESAASAGNLRRASLLLTQINQEWRATPVANFTS